MERRVFLVKLPRRGSRFERVVCRTRNAFGRKWLDKRIGLGPVRAHAAVVPKPTRFGCIALKSLRNYNKAFIAGLGAVECHVERGSAERLSACSRDDEAVRRHQNNSAGLDPAQP